MASQARDPDAKQWLAEAAQQWRDLARVTEALDRDRNGLPQSN